ncbi:MAG: hypothetical protein ACRDD2_07335 [Sarcina sp.]
MKKQNKKQLFLVLLLGLSFFLSYIVQPTENLNTKNLVSQYSEGTKIEVLNNVLLSKSKSSSSKSSSSSSKSSTSKPKATSNNSNYGTSDKFSKPKDTTTTLPNNKGSTPTTDNNSNYGTSDKFNSSTNNSNNKDNNSNNSSNNNSKKESYSNNSSGLSFSDLYFITSIFRSLRRYPAASIVGAIIFIAVISLIIKKLKNKN